MLLPLSFRVSGFYCVYLQLFYKRAEKAIKYNLKNFVKLQCIANQMCGAKTTWPGYGWEYPDKMWRGQIKPLLAEWRKFPEAELHKHK